MPGLHRLTTLIFSNGERGPWRQVSARGQQLGTVTDTPIETPAGCYAMGRLQDGTLWAATEQHFFTLGKDLTHRVQGARVETIAGQSAKFLYRIRRGERFKLPVPYNEYAAVLERLNPRTWAVEGAWTLPGFYSTFGYGQLAVNADDSVAYFVCASQPDTVERIDLATGATGRFLTGPTDIGGLLARGQDLVVGFTDRVRRYYPDCELAREYEPGVIAAKPGMLAAGTTDSFWVQGYADGTPYSTMFEVLDVGPVRRSWNLPDDGTRWDAPFVDPPLTFNATQVIVLQGFGDSEAKFLDQDGNDLGMPVSNPHAMFGDAPRTGNFGGFRALDNGKIGWFGFYTTQSPTYPEIHISDPDATLLASDVPGIYPSSSANPHDGSFYGFVRDGAARTIWKCDETTAARTALTTLASGSINPSESFAINAAASVAYGTTFGNRLSANAGIVYKMINTAGGAVSTFVDLHSGAYYTVNGNQAGLCLRDDTVVIGFSKNTSVGVAGFEPGLIRRFNPDGSTNMDYAWPSTVMVDGVPTASDGKFAPLEIHEGITPDTFWVSAYTNDAGYGVTFVEYDAATGAVLHAWATPLALVTGPPSELGNYFEFDGYWAVVPGVPTVMSCPDPCEDAGKDVPYYASSPEGTDVLFHDRMMNLIATWARPSSSLTVAAIAPSTEGLWIAYDDSDSGNSTLYLVKPVDGSLVRGPIPVEVRIAELAGAHALFVLKCDLLLTSDRATHELVSICLPKAPTGDDPETTAFVKTRYSLVIDPLDAALIDDGDMILYCDGPNLKLFNLTSNSIVRTIATAEANIHWPVVLNDGTVVVNTSNFLTDIGSVLQFTRTGALKARIGPTGLSSGGFAFTQGALGMTADMLTDACSCAEPTLSGVVVFAKESTYALRVDLPERTPKVPIAVPGVVPAGIDTSAALTVLNPSPASNFTESGSGDNADQQGCGGKSPIKRTGRCAQAAGQTSPSPNPGCALGGNGWVPSYTGAGGDVPACTDPPAGEDLFGKRELLKIIKIQHTAYPSLTTELLEFSTVPLGRPGQTYKEGRVRSLGTFGQSMSDGQGAMKSASGSMYFMDAEGRRFGQILADDTRKFFTRDEVTLQLVSLEGWYSGATPQTIGRALASGESYATPVEFQLSAIDPLFIDGGSFSPEKRTPQWTYPSYYVNNGGPKDLTSKYMPIIYGEKSDEGADGAGPRGKCPLINVGTWVLGTAPGGETWGRMNVCLYAIDRVVAVYGADLGGLGLYGRNARATLAPATDANCTEVVVVTLDTTEDLGGLATDQSINLILWLESGRTQVPITAVDTVAKTVTLNGSLDPATVQGVSWYLAPNDYVPKRVKIEESRNGDDVMVPKWAGYIRPTNYEDFVSDDETYRVTDLGVRGPLYEAHKAGEVTLACNVRGIEDKGDASGTMIRKFYVAENHWWDNMVHVQSPIPTGPGQLWPQVEADVPKYSDGYSKTKQSTFAAAQALSAARLGGIGRVVNAYLNEGIPNGDMAQLWNDNGFSFTYMDGYGRVCKYVFDAHADTTAWPLITHESYVFGREVARSRAMDEIMNVVQGGCEWDPDAGKFKRDGIIVRDLAAITRNKNYKKLSKHIDGKLTDDADQFTSGLNFKLFWHKDGPQYVRIKGCSADMAKYPPGTGIRFTSFIGPGTTGFVAQPMVIVDREFDYDKHTWDLVCVDVGDKVVRRSQQFIMTNDTSIAPVMSNDTTVAPQLAV